MPGQAAEFLFAIGGFLLLGLAADALGKRTFLPRVTLLLALGVLVGDQFLGIVPVSASSRFELIADVALMMVGFLLGGKLSLDALRSDGTQVLWQYQTMGYRHPRTAYAVYSWDFSDSTHGSTGAGTGLPAGMGVAVGVGGLRIGDGHDDLVQCDQPLPGEDGSDSG